MFRPSGKVNLVTPEMSERLRPVHALHEAEFWKLCWQSVDIYRFLTPVGHCRNLRCVVDRLKKCGASLAQLADPYARQDLVRNTDWFRVCADMANDFDWARFRGSGSHDHPIRLRFVNQIERGECPRATWYVADGVHRTLVAGVLLDQKGIAWQPFTAVTTETDTWSGRLTK